MITRDECCLISSGVAQTKALTVPNTNNHPVVLPDDSGLEYNAFGQVLHSAVDDPLAQLATAEFQVSLVMIAVSLATYAQRTSYCSAQQVPSASTPEPPGWSVRSSAIPDFRRTASRASAVNASSA